MPPDGEDAVAEMLRENLGEWQSELVGWQALAADGTYPGKTAIAHIRGIVAPLLAHKGSYELIEAFAAAKADLGEVTEDYEDIAGFFKSQKLSWDAMLKAVSDFSVNDKEIEKDEAAGKALADLRDILAMEAPYRRIREGSTLILTVAEANRQVLEKRRAHALEIIDPLIAKVKEELDQVQATPDLRNAALHEIQSIRKRVESQTSVSAIFMLQAEAREAYDNAFEKIARTVERLQRERVQQKHVEVLVDSGVVGGGTGGVPVRDAPPQPPAWKKKRVVRASDFANAGSYLESQRQVDEFLSSLRSALTEAIAKNERVEIR